jgi:rhodanese-related sulfurtransferase
MSKAIIFVLFLTHAIVATACSFSESNRETRQDTASPADTVAVKPFLVDVRTPEEFAAGSVKGAVNIPLDEVESRITEFQGKEEIVVFCRSGNRSAQAISILAANGITNVTNGGSWEDVAEKYK